jgi:hypothetical protein
MCSGRLHVTAFAPAIGYLILAFAVALRFRGLPKQSGQYVDSRQ